MDTNTEPLVAIVGETASGKTAVAVELAQRINGEIICADSRTIYRGIDIGSAKPSKEDQSLVPHHLMDIIDPDQRYNAAMFKGSAVRVISEVTKRGHTPIIVGGTGLYVDSVLFDYQFSNQSDPKLRSDLSKLSDEELTTILRQMGIEGSVNNVKNRRHIIRAIETGGAAPVDNTLRANTLVLGLQRSREVIRSRIIDRAGSIFELGFINETRDLAQQYGWNNESMSGARYRSARDYIEGRITLEETKQSFIRSDVQLAKRQRTWFKRNPNIIWFDNEGELIEKAVEFIRSFD